jgi:hypothetical protein
MQRARELLAHEFGMSDVTGAARRRLLSDNETEVEAAALRAITRALQSRPSDEAGSGEEWPADVAFLADVRPDWTILSARDGSHYGFRRSDGRVFKMPHNECPFFVLPRIREARALAAANGERGK